MSADSWTHAICVPCWNKKNPDRQTEGPAPAHWDYEERCCYCGGPTQGIYVREDPKQVHKVALNDIGPFEGEGL